MRTVIESLTFWDPKTLIFCNDLNPETFLAKATDEKIKEKLKKLTDDALKKGVFGAPTFSVNKKIFWGQDRLDYALDEYNS